MSQPASVVYPGATAGPAPIPGELKRKGFALPDLDTAPPPGSRKGDLLYHDIWASTKDEWWRTARAFEANPGSFLNAWQYLSMHPIYWRLHPWPRDDGLPLRHARHLETGNAFHDGGIWMHVTRVSPADGKHSDDSALNTRLEVWLESGEWSWAVREADHVDTSTHYHNTDLDCGGRTYEEAIIRLAINVHKHYGNDRRRCAPEWHESKRKKGNKRLKSSGMPGKVMVTTPYGHLCRHQYAPGLAGTLEHVDFEHAIREQRQPRTSVDAITRDMSSAARRLLALTPGQQAEVWHRLDDEKLAASPELAGSLAQMRRGGHGTPAAAKDSDAAAE